MAASRKLRRLRLSGIVGVLLSLVGLVALPAGSSRVQADAVAAPYAPADEPALAAPLNGPRAIVAALQPPPQPDQAPTGPALAALQYHESTALVWRDAITRHAVQRSSRHHSPIPRAPPIPLD